jgi:hypothetical protein
MGEQAGWLAGRSYAWAERVDFELIGEHLGRQAGG